MTDRRGWFLEHLVLIDHHLSGRWSWWLAKMMNGYVGDDPIPQVHFTGKGYDLPEGLRDQVGRSSSETESEVVKVIDRALDHGRYRIDDVVRWWLWGMGDATVPERPVLITAPWLYARMDAISRMMAYPADWAARILGATLYPKGNSNGWFPTPMEITTMMARMKLEGSDNRFKSVMDPCVGTGAMLLAASNFSLRLYGCDIDPQMVAWCRLQGYLFVPWLVKPGDRWVREIREAEAGTAPSSSPHPETVSVGKVRIPVRRAAPRPPSISSRNQTGGLVDVTA